MDKSIVTGLPILTHNLVFCQESENSAYFLIKKVPGLFIRTYSTFAIDKEWLYNMK